ncbi:hypothetical protein MRB53_036990 [Persea americana]|nr:hypothetical protein MRB53_036990 [Persea americana]
MQILAYRYLTVPTLSNVFLLLPCRKRCLQLRLRSRQSRVRLHWFVSSIRPEVALVRRLCVCCVSAILRACVRVPKDVGTLTTWRPRCVPPPPYRLTLGFGFWFLCVVAHVCLPYLALPRCVSCLQDGILRTVSYSEVYGERTRGAVKKCGGEKRVWFEFTQNSNHAMPGPRSELRI